MLVVSIIYNKCMHNHTKKQNKFIIRNQKLLRTCNKHSIINQVLDLALRKILIIGIIETESNVNK